MEYTGRYYEPVARSLAGAGLYVSVVNPKLIKDYGNNSLRKVKTDRADAVKIARYGIDNWTELREYNAMDHLRNQLQTLNRQFDFYLKQKTALKNNLISILDQTFPGVNTLFQSPVREDGHQKWVDFAASFWHVDCVLQCGKKGFAKRYANWCSRHGYNCRKGDADSIYEYSRELVATLPKNADSKTMVTTAITALTTISVIMEKTRSEMNTVASKLPEYETVINMFGVGPSLGPQLMAEIGDVRRFENRNSIIAFAGVDPGQNQSGTYEQKSVHTSKRGNSQLRCTLFKVMEVLIKTKPIDDPVYRFMMKKKLEGKPFHVYMTAGSNKFLRIYYGKVKEFYAATNINE
jgi:transposase